MVGYVQAHGTGTKAGDLAEATAFGEVLGAHRPAGRPQRIGSVKTDIGHRLTAFAPLFTLSVARRADLPAVAAQCAQWLHGHEAELAQFCFSANHRRTQYRHRFAIRATSHANLRAGLGELALRTITDSHDSLAPARVAFVFAGQGAQWWGMARQLMEHEPAFRAVVSTIDDLFRPLAGFSIIEELLREQHESRMGDTTVAHPALFAVQVGLSKLWELLGIRPSAVFGHSVGEVAAAYVSGALTLPQAVHVIHQRSHVQGAARGAGKMLAIGIGHERAIDFLRGRDGVSVAAVNGRIRLPPRGRPSRSNGWPPTARVPDYFIAGSPWTFPSIVA